MSRTLATGIDIGTHRIRVVVGECTYSGSQVTKKRIIGNGSAPSQGVRRGAIVNAHDAEHSIRDAVAQAEKSTGATIKEAFVSINGPDLEGELFDATISITRVSGEITEADVDAVMQTVTKVFESNEDANNRSILHTVPLYYSVDDTPVLGRPEGMVGKKLHVRALVISAHTQHIRNIVQAVEQSGIAVIDVVASPLAASIVNLNKVQKMAGAVLVNIGAETVSLIVYENNIPISLKVFPIGSTDITHDIALGFRIPLEEAETLKHGNMTSNHSEKELSEIIEARLTDIFELVEKHLKKIKKNGLLPAGIILTGGGAGLVSVDELAKATLGLPASLAHQTSTNNVRDASWSVAYGLCTLGLTPPDRDGITFNAIKKTGSTLKQWLGQFLP